MTGNISLLQLRAICALGEGHDPYSGCETPTLNRHRFASLQSLTNMGLVAHTGDSKYSLTPAGRKFYDERRKEMSQIMNLDESRDSGCAVGRSPVFLDYALRKLADVRYASIEPFIREYVEGVVVRPLLTSGMLTVRKDASPSARRIYLILVDAGMSAEETCITLFHELIHIMLLIAGVDESAHDENEIEQWAKRLARTFPTVSLLFERVFPGLSFPAVR